MEREEERDEKVKDKERKSERRRERMTRWSSHGFLSCGTRRK